MDQIQIKTLEKLNEQFDKKRYRKTLTNALCRNSLSKISMDFERYNKIDHTYSNVITHEMKVTEQKQSGRCWLFAALNLMRIGFCRKLQLEEFEFSQSYLFFYDKLEKSNYYLENIIKTKDEPLDSRLVSFLTDNALNDGGQWDMFVNLVKKYGVVPQVEMKDSAHCLNSREINTVLMMKLRGYAHQLRSMTQKNASQTELYQAKDRMIETIYSMLCLHFGNPPEVFNFEYKNKKKQFKRIKDLTPQSFFKDHVGFNLDEMVCLVHSPRKATPYNEHYTVKYLGNIVEGQKVSYLNVTIQEMKDACKATLKDDQPIWFGCDVGKYFDRDLGVMDDKLFNYDDLFDTSFKTSKEHRMLYGESQMTHAMLFTGMHLDISNSPTKWRVENSWGEKVGHKGYFIMTDTWFDEYMFEVAINKKYLPKAMLTLLEKEAINLEPWDPLGALA
jgi:bleomycin hydrolase